MPLLFRVRLIQSYDGRAPHPGEVRFPAATFVEIVCCGRFTDDDDRLYHGTGGAPPLSRARPRAPPVHDGTLFSIHLWAERWDLSDADHLAGVGDTVWSFTLATDEFENYALSALPDLPNVEIFEHQACDLGANALAAFIVFRWSRCCDTANPRAPALGRASGLRFHPKMESALGLSLGTAGGRRPG